MTFAQRRSRLTAHFSERIPVVKRRMAVLNRNILFILSPLPVGSYVVLT